MITAEVYKSFGWISVSITWLSVVFLIYNWRGDRSMSISKHAAAHKTAYSMMLLVESLVLPMFFLFVAKWVTPTFDLPIFFTVTVGAACSGLLLAAWIPDVVGWKGLIHGLAAYGAAILFIPALTAVYLSPNISSFTKNVSLLVLVYEMSAVVLFATIEKIKAYHLYIQGLYILLFDLTILTVAYIR